MIYFCVKFKGNFDSSNLSFFMEIFEVKDYVLCRVLLGFPQGYLKASINTSAAVC